MGMTDIDRMDSIMLCKYVDDGIHIKNVHQQVNGEEKSSFAFEDAMAFVGADMKVAA